MLLITTQKGSLAEWLGTGLQNRLRRFESARNLKETSETAYIKRFRGFVFYMDKIGERILFSSANIYYLENILL